MASPYRRRRRRDEPNRICRDLRNHFSVRRDGQLTVSRQQHVAPCDFFFSRPLVKSETARKDFPGRGETGSNDILWTFFCDGDTGPWKISERNRYVSLETAPRGYKHERPTLADGKPS